MNLFNFSVWVVIIQLLGFLAIAGYVIATIFSLILRGCLKSPLVGIKSSRSL